MALFKIGDTEYQSTKMLPETQLNVLARLSPLFTNYNTLRGIMNVVLKREDAKEAAAAGVATVEPETEVAKEDVTDQLLHALSGMFSAFASMSDEDRHFIITRCLSLCTRRSGGGWAKIWNDAAKRPMFEDIDLPTTLLIVKEVLQAELLPFLNMSMLSSFVGLMR